MNLLRPFSVTLFLLLLLPLAKFSLPPTPTNQIELQKDKDIRLSDIENPKNQTAADITIQLHSATIDAKPSKAPIRIACIGDSITKGLNIENPESNSYPAQLQKLLGERFIVKNFGNSGRGIVKASKRGQQKRAYIFMPEHKDAQDFQPDIIICNLGINDIMDWDKFGKSDFISDYRDLIQSYKSLASRPRIILWQPLAPLFKGQTFHGNPNVNAINKAIATVASQENVETMDLAAPLKEKSNLFPDHIHPNAEGAKIIAQTILKHLEINRR